MVIAGDFNGVAMPLGPSYSFPKRAHDPPSKLKMGGSFVLKRREHSDLLPATIGWLVLLVAVGASGLLFSQGHGPNLIDQNAILQLLNKTV